MPDVYSLYFDGSCWPNPGGIGGAGFILRHGFELVEQGHFQINKEPNPKLSNNVAEYYGLEAGLKSFRRNYDGATSCVVNVFGDSQLVIKQMNKVYKINDGKLYTEKAKQVRHLVIELRSLGVKLNFQWIPREQNQECDDLSKEHLK